MGAMMEPLRITIVVENEAAAQAVRDFAAGLTHETEIVRLLREHSELLWKLTRRLRPGKRLDA